MGDVPGPPIISPYMLEGGVTNGEVYVDPVLAVLPFLKAARPTEMAAAGALRIEGTIVAETIETMGPRIVSPRGVVDLDEFRRLNVLDPAISRLRPGEASAAVELQQVLAGRLERLPGPSGADFEFVSGPQVGKSVDFLLTPGTVKEAAGINQFFVKNADRFSVQLSEHLAKADIVPIDARFLTPANQKVLMGIVGRLPAASQSRIIIFR